MSAIRLGILAGLALGGGLPAAGGAAEGGWARRAVGDNGVIRLRDYGYRDWGGELVHYRVDTGRFRPGQLVLLGPDGKAVPFQVRRGVLSFVARLAKGKSVAYRLQACEKDRSRENSSLTVRTAGEAVEIANAHFALRLPRPGKKAFSPPAPAGTVPPPILAWRQAGFGWVGSARLVTARRVASVRRAIVEEGPASVVYEARYRFAPRGEYLWRVRVGDALPAAIVTEEFDFAEITDGRDWLLLGLGANWKPERIGYVEAGKLKLQPAAELIRAKAREQNAAVANVSPFIPPRPAPPREGLVLLGKITPTGAWGPWGSLELRGAKRAGAEGEAGSIAVCPWHVGVWRRTMSLTAWHDPGGGGVQVALPISVRASRWYLDLADDQSPFSTHEHDPGLPASYGRREWALAFGADDIVNARIDSGYVGLDRYKDWTLDWPEDRAKATYPRAYATPAILARLRKGLDTHPEKDLLAGLYLFDGEVDSAVASARRALKAMGSTYGSPWRLFGLPGYMQTYFRTWMPYAEDALACGSLPADLRAELRRRLALWAHLYAEPDYNPRAAGVHLGNPNMPIGRTSVLALFAAMLPDHPRYTYWMEQVRTWTAYRLAINTTPGGAWFEPPTYQMYGPTRALTLAQVLVRNGGFGDLGALPYHRRVLEYNAHLTMPDPRYKGWRILPGMGNSGNTLESVWGMGVGVVEQADREQAGFFRFMHRLCSGNGRLSRGREPAYSFFYLPDVPERPRTLKTTYIPGYGVAFRAHFGSPLETAMLFRCGYNKSHWDMDDLNVILYAQGAPLSPGTGYQYYYGPATKNDGVYHNRVKPGRIDAHEPFGRVENTIQDYGFGERADYALGRVYYPREYFADGKGGMDWRRGVMFLKSAKPAGPSYFVLRDGFADAAGRPGGAGREARWHWLNLGTADRVRVGGRAFDKGKVALNKPVGEGEMPVLRGRTIELGGEYGASSWMWFARPADADVRAVMTFDYRMAPNYFHRSYGKALGVLDQADTETKTILRMSGKADEGFLYVVYPLRDGQPPPTCTSPAPGCVKVVTGEATDYVFLGDAAMSFRGEGVVFTGRAGAVRVFADRVALCMNAGSGRVGYKGCVLKGCGPFERTVARAKLKPGEQDVGGREKRIVSVDIGSGIVVRGEAPFTAALEGRTIRIRTTGRARTLVLTRPAFIHHPDLLLDGVRWMAGWTDYPGSNWGRWERSNLMCVSTLDGEHELVIREMVYPQPWRRQFVPALVPGRAAGGGGPGRAGQGAAR